MAWSQAAQDITVPYTNTLRFSLPSPESTLFLRSFVCSSVRIFSISTTVPHAKMLVLTVCRSESDMHLPVLTWHASRACWWACMRVKLLQKIHLKGVTGMDFLKHVHMKICSIIHPARGFASNFHEHTSRPGESLQAASFPSQTYTLWPPQQLLQTAMVTFWGFGLSALHGCNMLYGASWEPKQRPLALWCAAFSTYEQSLCGCHYHC